MSTLREEIREISGEYEVLTAEVVSERLNVSQRDANNALAALARAGELTRVSRGHYSVQTGQVVSFPSPNDDVQVTYEPDESDDTEDFIVWLAKQFDLDPEDVAIAFAYYSVFLAAG